MKPDFLLCDKCKCKIPLSNQISVTVDKQMDGAGDIDDVVYTYDLCFNCLREYVYKVIFLQGSVPYYQEILFKSWMDKK